MLILSRLCETVGVSVDVATRIANGLQAATPASPAASVPSDARCADRHPCSWRPIRCAAGRSSALSDHDAPADLARHRSRGSAHARALRRRSSLQLPKRRHGQRQHRARAKCSVQRPGLDLATAEQHRPVAPTDAVQVDAGLASRWRLRCPPARAAHVGVKSSFFEVRGRLRLGDVVLEQRSLVQRLSNGDVKVLRRERVASRELGGS